MAAALDRSAAASAAASDRSAAIVQRMGDVMVRRPHDAAHAPALVVPRDAVPRARPGGAARLCARAGGARPRRSARRPRAPRARAHGRGPAEFAGAGQRPAGRRSAAQRRQAWQRSAALVAG